MYKTQEVISHKKSLYSLESTIWNRSQPKPCHVIMHVLSAPATLLARTFAVYTPNSRHLCAVKRDLNNCQVRLMFAVAHARNQRAM